MCSYQSVSDANCGNNPIESWEENIWGTMLSPSFNTSITRTYNSQISDPRAQTYSKKNVPRSHDYQMQFPTTCQSAKSYSVVSPSRDESFKISQTCTNMSTYFSTFDPLSQFQDDTIHNGPVKKICNAKTQNAASNRNIHQARISLVPSGNGHFKAIVKRKRKRTAFTTEQLEVLEDVFSKKPYVTRDERQILVQKLQVNDKSVKIWFQNRRLKNKRGDNQEVQDDNQYSIFDRLDIMESEIKERTDEFGYVTLDDKIVNDLVNVIDDYFTNKASPVRTKTELDNSPIYEPISPASTSDNSCEEDVVEHYKLKDIVQELTDLESIVAV